MANVHTKGKNWWERNRSDPAPIKTNFADFVQGEYFQQHDMPDKKDVPYTKQKSFIVPRALDPIPFDPEECATCGGRGVVPNDEVNRTRTHYMQHILCPDCKSRNNPG